MDKKIICFDIDGTLTVLPNVWTYLGEKFGVENLERIDVIRKSDLPRTEKSRQIIKIFKETKNSTKENLIKIYDSFPLRKNVAEVFKQLKSRGFLIYLITGGPVDLAELYNNRYELDGYYYMAHWEFDQDGLLDQYVVVDPLEQGNKKADFINEISKNTITPVDKIYFVGDSVNDLAAFKLTGKGILIETAATPDELRMAAKYRIEDLLEIVDIVDGE